MSFRLVFDPISGQFEFKKLNSSPTSVVGGGASVVSGTLVIPTGAQVVFQNELTLGASGEILLETGADILIE